MQQKFQRIAMLSTHGYFDPVPMLGRTDTGGQVVYVLELANAISRQGIPVDIFTRWFDKTQAQVNPVPGHPDVRVIRIHSGPWEFMPKETIYDFLPELSENMISWVKKNTSGYDLYHGHYVDAGIVTLDVAEALNKPPFFTAHSLGAWKRQQMGGDPVVMEKKFNFRHRISEEQRIFDKVNGHTLTSEVQMEKLEELYEVRNRNIGIIPPGVDIHRFKPRDTPRENNMDGIPQKYIFCLSRIDTNKGHDFLLKAFSRVCSEDEQVMLVIGGGSQDPGERERGVFERMHDIIRERGMGERVRMIGYVPDNALLSWYQNAEMFVLPSLFEPFGMTSQEAMACGKTVVASKFGGIRNVITDGENGLLVDPSDEAEFSRAMLRLLRDKALNQTLSEAAYKKIVEEYSWEAIAGRFLEFYQRYI
ncbi:MAG: glycosyltransferase [Bacteroidales bacterium]